MSNTELISILGARTSLQKHSLECDMCQETDIHWYCSNANHGFCESWDEHREKLDESGRVIVSMLHQMESIFDNPNAVKMFREIRESGQMMLTIVV